MDSIKEYVDRYKGTFVGKDGTVGSYVENEKVYRGQCVSLVYYFLKLFSTKYTRDSYGNARDYINLPNAQPIKSYSELEDGDLIIWTGGAYGHIGIWYNGRVFNQNPHKARLDNIEYFLQWGIGNPKFYRPTLDRLVAKQTKPKLGTYITKDYLNIRECAGENCKVKLVGEITLDGRRKVTSGNKKSMAILDKGVKVDVLEVKQLPNKMWWGRIPSGWVAMKYLKEI